MVWTMLKKRKILKLYQKYYPICTYKLTLAVDKKQNYFLAWPSSLKYSLVEPVERENIDIFLKLSSEKEKKNR